MAFLFFVVYLDMLVTSQQIDELETFFAKAKLPKTIQLDAGLVIADIGQFVKSHINVLRLNFEKPIYAPFYDRLQKLKQLLETKN
jgi:hypothetical protein